MHSYRTIQESTLYCIVIGQWRTVPYIALLSDNEGKYLILQSYRTVQESTLHFCLKIQESTLYCICIGHCRNVSYIAFSSDNEVSRIMFCLTLNIYLTTEVYPTLYVYLTGGKFRHCPLTLDTWLTVTVYLTLDEHLGLQEVGQRLF